MCLTGGSLGAPLVSQGCFLGVLRTSRGEATKPAMEPAALRALMRHVPLAVVLRRFAFPRDRAGN